MCFCRFWDQNLQICFWAPSSQILKLLKHFDFFFFLAVNFNFFVFYISCLHIITYLHAKFQDQRANFDNSWIIIDMTVNIIFFFYISHLGKVGKVSFTLKEQSYIHTNFQDQRTNFDKSCIINEMAVNFNLLFIFHVYTSLPTFMPNFKTNGPIFTIHE